MTRKIFIVSIILTFLFFGRSYSQPSQQILSLKAGFNFIAFTVKPSQTPVELIAQAPSIQEIYVYNAAAGSFLSAGEGSLTTLNAGRGYIIKANAAAAVNISGAEITNIGNISLKAGFNLAGFSKTIAAVKFSELMAANNMIRGIYKFNAASGSFIQVIRGGNGIPEPIDGTDPACSAGQSYFFNLQSDAVLNYDNGTIASFAVDPAQGKVETPSFNPKAYTYTSAQTVTISCATPDATIKYTLDGTAPSDTNGVTFTQPIVISSTTTLNAIAIKTGMENSYIATANYVIVILQKTAAPVFSVAEGSYDRTFEVSVTSATPGATIRYTLDWSTPSPANGIIYTLPLALSGQVVIKAFAGRKGMLDSDISQASYMITVPKIPAPVISPPGGIYNYPQSVSISCATDGVIIKYTTDGTVPSAAGGVTYSSPFVLSQSAVVKAFAYRQNYFDSTPVLSRFTIEASKPRLTAVNIKSSNPDNTRAVMNDDITLSFTSDKALIARPFVTIAGHTAEVKIVSGNSYTAKYKIAPSDQSGVAAFTIDFTDFAGNAGDRIVSTTDGSSVVYNNQVPDLYYVHVTSNGSTPARPRAGHIITLTFRSDGALKPTPAVTIAGKAASVTAITDASYEARYTVASTDADGPVAFAIDYLNESGSAGNRIVSTTDASAVRILKDITLANITLSSNNAASNSYAIPGAVVTLSFTAIGPLSATPEVAIAGKSATVGLFGANTYIASRVMGSADAEGIIPFLISYKNATGVDCLRSDVTSGPAITFDKTPPALTDVSLVSSNIDPARAIAGDILTLSYVSSEPLRDNHGFALANNYVIPYTAENNHYFAECILDTTDVRAGTVNFSLEFYDRAGNRGTNVTATASGNAVTFDSGYPSLTYVFVRSSNAVSERAVTGDTVTLNFASNKPLNGMPAVTIAGHTVAATGGRNNEYAAAYTMASGDTQGNVLFTIDYADTAGRSGNRATAGTDKSSVTFDNTPPPANPKIFKVLVINFDPIVESEGGVRLHTLCEGRNDPRPMAEYYINDLKICSNGNAHYQIVEWRDVDEYPVKTDGFRYTDETFMACLRGQAQWHEPSGLDYRAVIKDFNIASRVMSGEIDEVFLFGAHWFGPYESQMAGPTAYWCNSPPIKDVDSGRNFVIMWFNYGRWIGEMLENYCHRTESIMDKVYGRAPAGQPLNNWQQFTNYDHWDPGHASAGSCHWAPNSLRDYDWGNCRPVFSTCDDWFNWPNLTGAGRIVTCADWGGGDIREHHKWWFRHIPHAEGVNADGKQNNWWKYIADFNSYPESR